MIEKSNNFLIDSNIIIYHLNAEQIATDFLKRHLSSSFISRLTFIEVMSFDFTQEEKQDVLSLLNSFKIIDTSKDIAFKALENREKKKIKLADNIIAATAQVNNLILVTRNIKDFNNIDIKLLNIFEQK